MVYTKACLSGPAPTDGSGRRLLSVDDGNEEKVQDILFTDIDDHERRESAISVEDRKVETAASIKGAHEQSPRRRLDALTCGDFPFVTPASMSSIPATLYHISGLEYKQDNKELFKSFTPEHTRRGERVKNRFGKGLYLSEHRRTPCFELAHHDYPANTGFSFQVNKKDAKLLDLTNVTVRERVGYDETCKNSAKQPEADPYQCSRYIAERAACAGFNIIKW
jgi:hypothetical protein